MALSKMSENVDVLVLNDSVKYVSVEQCQAYIDYHFFRSDVHLCLYTNMRTEYVYNFL